MSEQVEAKVPAFYRLNRAEKEFEQVVYGEVLVPDVPNVYGDIYTRDAIREFVYEFARQGFGIDVEHDNSDIMGGKAHIVESFIARPGDPDFIEGSWVVGMRITDPDLWQKVLDGEINGFSYEATCELTEIVIEDTGNRVISGLTEPDPIDGHTHRYTVIVDVLNRVVAGGTEMTDGHMHTISHHTYTDEANSHTHRFQVISDDVGATDE